MEVPVGQGYGRKECLHNYLINKDFCQYSVTLESSRTARNRKKGKPEGLPLMAYPGGSRRIASPSRRRRDRNAELSNESHEIGPLEAEGAGGP